MSVLRSVLPTLAAFLVAVVFVQATDLVACADEAGGAREAGGVHVDAFAQGAHATTAPGDTHNEAPPHDDGPSADCYCHVVFAPTGAFSTVAVEPSSDRTDFAVFVASRPEVESQGLDPVPLA